MRITHGALRFANWAILIAAVAAALSGFFSSSRWEEKIWGSLAGTLGIGAIVLVVVRHPEYLDDFAMLFREE